jgi:dissimilatory sulfite reductase (desulfoviridin) alpha/beta subunit
MKWADEAEKAMGRVPFFVRKRVRKRVEEEAARQGAPVVLLRHVHDCQKSYLENMDQEVRGFQVETCFGPNGCPNRAVGVEGLADRLENLMRKKDLRGFLIQKVKGPLKLHHDFRISVSDCPNGCSRPQIADVGILGACKPKTADSPCTQCEACVEVCKEGAITLDEGPGPVLDESRCVLCGQCARACPSGALLEGTQGYRIQLGGKLGRHPQLGRELDGIYSPEETLQIVERCVDFYMEHCLAGERFAEVLNRLPLKL